LLKGAQAELEKYGKQDARDPRKGRDSDAAS